MIPRHSANESSKADLDDLVDDLKREALLDDMFVKSDQTKDLARISSNSDQSENTVSPYDDFERLYDKLAANVARPRTLDHGNGDVSELSLKAESLDFGRFSDKPGRMDAIPTTVHHGVRRRRVNKKKRAMANYCTECAAPQSVLALRCRYCHKKIVSNLLYYFLVLIGLFLFLIWIWLILSSKDYR